jgi:hypothetical protein
MDPRKRTWTIGLPTVEPSSNFEWQPKYFTVWPTFQSYLLSLLPLTSGSSKQTTSALPCDSGLFPFPPCSAMWIQTPCRRWPNFLHRTTRVPLHPSFKSSPLHPSFKLSNYFKVFVGSSSGVPYLLLKLSQWIVYLLLLLYLKGTFLLQSMLPILVCICFSYSYLRAGSPLFGESISSPDIPRRLTKRTNSDLPILHSNAQ